MLPQKLAFVDIETTGARVTRDRIIEIGIIRVEEGKVVETYNTLINPQMYLPPYISQFTGITADDLVNAPMFTEVAQRINELLTDCVFVAHNVRFDYGFLKNEFRRFGYTYSAKQFCTVKLSRQLFPQYPKHNLDSIIERFNLDCPNRHRALDDARATWEFVQCAQNIVSEELFGKAIQTVLKRPAIPQKLDPTTFDKLPESPGVYVFYGDKNYPLYVGKSKNIKERVLSHFTNDYTASKEMTMCQQTERIETIQTAGELGALLLESKMVKQMQPLYNRQLRKSKGLLVLKRITNADGYESVSIEPLENIGVDERGEILGVYRTKTQLKESLTTLATEHMLCHKLLGLEKASFACFGSQLGTCHGACDKKEMPLKYNMRFTQAFTKSKLRRWPFPGPIVITEQDAFEEHYETFLIDQWCLLDQETLSPYTFDVDTYKILAQYMFNPKYQAQIRVLKPDELTTSTEQPEFASI